MCLSVATVLRCARDPEGRSSTSLSAVQCLFGAMASSQAITHAQRVTRLYRHVLKNSLSWRIDRTIWREEALEIRARFDANKLVQDRRLALALVQQGEDELQKNLHPDPYIGKLPSPASAVDGHLL